MHERGLAESRERARALILAGEVSVNGQRVDKPGAMVPSDAGIECSGGLPYVSRGGLKLAHALDTFTIQVRGRVALDAGASTGGFTDVLLQRGAARVYAVDVGYGQLSWKLRQDPRVVVMERTNVRHLRELPEPVSIVTADLSFISLTLVLEPLVGLATPDADLIVLIKPQFEAGPAQVGGGGVVRDPEVRRAVIEKVHSHARSLGLTVQGLTTSPILGPAGNVEFLAWYSRARPEPPNTDAMVRDALARAEELVSR